jgi:hypothetical protein
VFEVVVEVVVVTGPPALLYTVDAPEPVPPEVPLVPAGPEVVPKPVPEPKELTPFPVVLLIPLPYPVVTTIAGEPVGVEAPVSPAPLREIAPAELLLLDPSAAA